MSLNRGREPSDFGLVVPSVITGLVLKTERKREREDTIPYFRCVYV